MSEQNTPTLDDLFGNGALNLGSGEPAFDPFVIPETPPADSVVTNPQELFQPPIPNITPFPAADDTANDDESADDGEGEQEADDNSAELTFEQLSAGDVRVRLMEVFKTTGEVKDCFKFTYRGRDYKRLSRSEKILAGVSMAELVKQLTGHNYPMCIDDSESVVGIPRPTGQAILCRVVAGAPLNIWWMRCGSFRHKRWCSAMTWTRLTTQRCKTLLQKCGKQ